MLIKEAFVFIVLFFCTTANTLSTHYNQATKDGSVFTSTNVESTSKVIQEPLTSGLDSNDVIQRYLASVLQKRATVNQQTFAVGPKLSTDIVAQIKARIHTQITSKMSASILQNVKTNLSIKAWVMGTVVNVDNAQIEAIQTAAVDGLQTQISHTIEQKIEKVLSESIGGSNDLFPKDQKVLTVSQLSKVLMNAETIVRSQLKVTLPEIQETLKSCVDTNLKAHVKELELGLPGILKIQVSAKIDVTSSVKTVVHRVYKSYADVSVAVVVQSYIKGIQEHQQKKKTKKQKGIAS